MCIPLQPWIYPKDLILVTWFWLSLSTSQVLVPKYPSFSLLDAFCVDLCQSFWKLAPVFASESLSCHWVPLKLCSVPSWDPVAGRTAPVMTPCLPGYLPLSHWNLPPSPPVPPRIFLMSISLHLWFGIYTTQVLSEFSLWQAAWKGWNHQLFCRHGGKCTESFPQALSKDSPSRRHLLVNWF